MKTVALALSIGVLFASGALAAEHRVEVLDEGPPEGLSPEIAAALAPSGLKVTQGASRTVCEIWLAREWNVKPGFEPDAQTLYPFEAGQLIGVVNYPRKGADFRDQDINKGLYTLRYALQPVDGNHVGTSPTRDFLLLVYAEKDTSAGPMPEKELASLSAEAAESTHPAMLSMQRLQDAGSTPSIRHDEDRDWWIVRFQGKAKAGDQTRDLPVELVVVGIAAE